MNPKSWTGVKGCPNLSYSPPINIRFIFVR